jgi:hypothetical protein
MHPHLASSHHSVTPVPGNEPGSLSLFQEMTEPDTGSNLLTVVAVEVAGPATPEVPPRNQNTRRGRKDCLLTIEERRVLEPFKEKYRSEVLRERRMALVKSEIMVAYFNFLASRDEAPRTPEELKEKTKVCRPSLLKDVFD